jgi:hypothetical protein
MGPTPPAIDLACAANRLVSPDPCSLTYVYVAVQLALDLYIYCKFRPESAGSS